MDAQSDAEALLTLWERGLARNAAERGDALLEAARDSAAAPRTLGERNAMLAGLHARFFGRDLALRSHCPGCGSAAQFEADCEALAAMSSVTGASPTHRFASGAHEIEFRLPTPGDVSAVATSGAHDDFPLRLLERCVIGCTREGALVAVHDVEPAVLDALSAHIEALDPGACISFAVECPQCEAHWSARCDLGLALWQKTQAAAERVLLEVDLLARTYGWTEPEVLRLTPTRRAAYLQLSAAP